MQRHDIETQREETLKLKAPLIYRHNEIWHSTNALHSKSILYPTRPSPLLSTSIIHCNCLWTTQWPHHVDSIVASTEDLCSQNPHISHSKHSVTSSQPTTGIQSASFAQMQKWNAVIISKDLLMSQWWNHPDHTPCFSFQRNRPLDGQSLKNINRKNHSVVDGVDKWAF